MDHRERVKRVNTSFVLAQSDWFVSQARDVLAHSKASHVIIHRSYPSDYYYLYRREILLELLAERQDQLPLWIALDLHETTSTPVLAFDEVSEAPRGRYVVHVEDRVVGFDDPPRVVFGGQGPTRGGIEPPQPAASADAGSPEVGRTLTAQFPKQTPKDSLEWLLVSVEASTELVPGIPLSLPEGTDIDVLVQAVRGFVVESADKGSLTIGSGDGLPLQFKLRAVELGPGLIRVTAFYQGKGLGSIKLTPVVTEPTDVSAKGPSATETARGALADFSVQVPDLAMLIEERINAAGFEYLIRLTTRDPALGLNLKKFGPLQIRIDPARYFQDFFRGIDQIPKDSAAQELASRGSYLFQTILPKDLQEQLWSLRTNIQSVIIQSEEPWIPWELLKLCGTENGRIVEGPFLCESYMVTRWVQERPFKKPSTLNNIALVVPQDSQLPHAESEREYLASLKGDGREVTRVPAIKVNVREALASGRYDCWHFTGHGAVRDQNPDRSEISLENADKLLPEEISGEVMNLGLARPLVFLNACQVGKGGMSLTGVGGWARRFLEAGAGAFIGPYWSVYDESAATFARSLYGHLLAGVPLGRAVKEARSKTRVTGDTTWLAYTVFGDPLARFQA